MPSWVSVEKYDHTRTMRFVPHRILRTYRQTQDIIVYKLCFYVPASHLEAVKTALFEAGAGRYRNYDQCSWQVLGQGQFRPLTGSEPHLGNTGQLEKLAEYKVEMVCDEAVIKSVLQTLIPVHPYEEPAYEIYKILTVDDF